MDTEPSKEDRLNQTAKREPAVWEDAFFAALALTGVVTQAALLAHVSRQYVHACRKRYADFAARWKRAMSEATDVLEEEARRRALFEGSDTLLIFLLKGARPKKYRDNWKGEITTPRDQPLQMEHRVTRDDLDRIYDELEAASGSVPEADRRNGNSKSVDSP